MTIRVKHGDTHPVTLTVNADLTGAATRLLARDIYAGGPDVELAHTVTVAATGTISHPLTGTLPVGAYALTVELTREGVTTTAPSSGFFPLLVEAGGWLTLTTTDDVVTALGPLGPRVKASDGVNLEDQLAIARASAHTALAEVYGTGQLPTFGGVAGETIRWAVAKLAAAQILDILRAHLNADGSVPDDLRASAYRDLGRPLLGYPVGAELDDDGHPIPPRPAPLAVGIFYGADGSAFPDPYTGAEPW